MTESLYTTFIARFFPKLQTLVEKYNEKKTQPTYLHKEMLRAEYSPDQKWSSASVDTHYVKADMVSLDSPLPIKNRDRVAEANGELPKIGMKRILKESQINALNLMKAQAETAIRAGKEEAGRNMENRIVAKLANDAVACAFGVDEANEANFLTGLSNGVVLVEDDENTGIGFRANYGYPDDNVIGVDTVGSLTVDDLKRALEQADSDGNTPEEICIAKSTYDTLRKSDSAKVLWASYRGISYSDVSTLPEPTAANFNEAFESETGVRFLVINRSVKYEKNGVRKNYKPWNSDHVILIPSHEVGALVYGTPAEDTNRASQAEYQTVDGYKLISKYSLLDPLREVTAVQALALPVIEDVDAIYMIDLTVQNEDSETATDSSDTASSGTTDSSSDSESEG